MAKPAFSPVFDKNEYSGAAVPQARVPLRLLLPNDPALQVPRPFPWYRLAAFLVTGGFLVYLFYQGWASPLITMQRTACLDDCPVYELTIYPDGQAIYKWEEPAFRDALGSRKIGTKVLRLDRDAVSQLASEFDQAGYFGFNNAYERRDADDHSFAVTTFTFRGQTKKIRHYLGDSTAPKVLTMLEEKIDDALNTGLSRVQ